MIHGTQSLDTLGGSTPVTTLDYTFPAVPAALAGFDQAEPIMVDTLAADETRSRLHLRTGWTCDEHGITGVTVVSPARRVFIPSHAVAAVYQNAPA